MPKIKAIPNPEKKKSEKWADDPNRDLLDFPRPFRWGILGAVSCGKTSLILNYLVRSHHYDNIFIMHPQTYNPNIPLEDEASNNNIIVPDAQIPEYKGVQFIGLSYLPSMKYFDNIANKFNLFIIDDCDLCTFMRKRRELREERLNKLFSYVSSHKNVSIIVSSQDASSQLPGFCLKMCNVITIYKQLDEYVVATLSRKISIGYRKLKALLALCKGKHDNITFDFTDDTKYLHRLNIYQNIDIEYKDASTKQR
jgi:hypothetical protein